MAHASLLGLAHEEEILGYFDVTCRRQPAWIDAKRGATERRPPIDWRPHGGGRGSCSTSHNYNWRTEESTTPENGRVRPRGLAHRRVLGRLGRWCLEGCARGKGAGVSHNFAEGGCAWTATRQPLALNTQPLGYSQGVSYPRPSQRIDPTSASGSITASALILCSQLPTSDIYHPLSCR